MPTLTFLLSLFFATFHTTAVPAINDGGKKTETKTSVGKDQSDYIIGDDLNLRKP